VGTGLLPGFFYDVPGDDPALVDFYDDDPVTVTSSSSTGSFVDPSSSFAEEVEVRRPTGVGADYDVIVRGRYGYEVSPGTITVNVAHGWRPGPVLAGDVVVGLVSGATLTVGSVVPNPVAGARRFRVYLDYTQFRAFFMVGLPRQHLGDFGFAYGSFPENPYDGRPTSPNFYDGFPTENASTYKQLWQRLDKIRAAGVTLDFYQEDGSCA
jgi:hypothetical protein